MQPWLGTFVEVGVEAGRTAEVSIGAAFAAIEQVHRLLSFQEPGSDLSRLNRARGRPVALHPLSVTVLRMARAFMSKSEERFNCTVGGALERLGTLPAPEGIAALEQGSADDIVAIDRRWIRLNRPVHITLDGIAKGFAVDRAIRALRVHGASSGWVNAGGDLRSFGAVPLPLALRDPAGYRLVGHFSNRAVATSMTSAEPDRRFPARIVSTTGEPVRAGSWTVLAREAWRADALTKVAPLVPRARRTATIRRLGGQLISSGAPLQ